MRESQKLEVRSQKSEVSRQPSAVSRQLKAYAKRTVANFVAQASTPMLFTS
ncbi:hypothetical protein [Moorena sp. SIO2C4]|uniref:hypothetical protein n=1 Tax=Moorena sp. SIO2C4 TaxID=2607824 RepID=UPI0013C6718B|nr:hypothetical protein [Moorena sp. SIO2C4]NES46625.1 hypothetical protein [Moorena sp. SIO2C4]